MSPTSQSFRVLGLGLGLFLLAIGTFACDDGGGGGGTPADIPEDTPTTTGETGALRGITSAHNVVRASVDAGLDPLTWDANVAAFAQEWADELATRGCDLEHRPRSGEFAQRYGENIFWASGGSWTAQDVVESWASEAADYDYDSNTCSNICGHYTQIVWRDTSRLGCGRATCGSQEVWVCNYDPPGNVLGERPY